MPWFVPLIWGVSAVSTAFAASKIAGDVRKVKETELEQERVNERVEVRRTSVTPEQAVTATTGATDDVLLFLRKLFTPAFVLGGALIVGAIVLLSRGGKK